jgi:hypothetical protein
MRKSNWRTDRRAIASAIGRKRGLASVRARAGARLTREIDADTLRKRAAFDARGQILREGRTYSSSGVTHWRVVRSFRGRTDQRDVLVNGLLFRTCGPRRLPAWLRY